MARPRKPDVLCPHCHSDKVACIVYGYVDGGDEWFEMLSTGLVTGGGCLINYPLTRLFCNACERDFGTDDESERIADRIYRRARDAVRRRLKRRRQAEQRSPSTSIAPDGSTADKAESGDSVPPAGDVRPSE